jgi:hypothetical protein
METMPKEQLSKDIVVYVQEKGCVYENVLMKWLNDVWFDQPGALLNKKLLLIWDMSHTHLLESVKNNLKQKRTNQAIIPG